MHAYGRMCFCMYMCARNGCVCICVCIIRDEMHLRIVHEM